MNELFDAAREIQEFLAGRHWRFCIIGGLAAIRWGEPQATQDVDVSLLTGFGNEREYVEEILRSFHGRIPDVASFATQNRVLLVSASNGRSIDVGLAGIPFEQRMIERASVFTFAPGISLVTCSAEDLVVLKAFAGRPKDWSAVEGVLISQADDLDWDYIHEHLPPLCELKEDPDAPVRLEQLRRQLEDS